MRLGGDEYQDYKDWLAMRAQGRHARLAHIATHLGLPAGGALALLGVLAATSSGGMALTSAALQACYLMSMSTVTAVFAGWLEWRHVEHKFERARPNRRRD